MRLRTLSPHVFFVLASLIVLGPRAAAADSITLMWDANSEPTVAGYIVHVGAQPGTYTQHVDVGLTTTFSLATALAGQQYCFAVSAYVAGPVEGPNSSEVCGFSNVPPTLVNPGARSSALSQPTNLQLQGSDPDGQAVSYSATGLPAGLTLQGSTGFISGTPTTAGSFSVTATVSDGVLTASQSFTWTITPAADATAPVVTVTGPTSAATHTSTASSVALAGTASDQVGVTQVTWVNNRGGSGTATGTSSWTAASVALQVGSNAITVTARDAAGNTGTDVITVTYNVPPTLAAIANQSTAAGQTVSLQLAGSDPNGTAVSYSATGLPAGLSLGATSGLITGAPTTSGTYSVVATVSDGSLTASRTFTWTVVAPVNTAPVVTITAPTTASTYATTLASVSLSGGATDDVAVTQVTWVNSRGGSGAASGASVWTIAGVALLGGQNVITVTARDAAGNASTDVLTVTYNTAPVLAAVAAQVTEVGRQALLAIGASDVDGDVLTYGANGLPPGLALTVATGIVSGTPTVPGTFPVTVTVFDGVQSASATFTWTVAADVTAPAVTVSQPTTAATFSATTATVTVAGSASDLVGVTQVSWVNDRGGSGAATGTSSWSASVSLQSGVNVVTVTARDAVGNTATDVLTVTRITTASTPTAPTLAAVPNQSTRVGQPVSLQLVASDVNGDTLMFGALNLPRGLSISSTTGRITGTPTSTGTYHVTVAASDGTLHTVRTFTWTIRRY
jgi:hypothetical protein